MTTIAERVARIEALIRTLEQAPEPARSTARELVAAVLEMHREALSRIVPRLDSAALDDDLVSSVLVLHELHPASIPARVTKALGRAPHLGAGLVEVRDARVRIRVADPALRGAVEQLVWDAAPDALGVSVEDARGALILPVAR
jgi:hypothetical protein